MFTLIRSLAAGILLTHGAPLPGNDELDERLWNSANEGNLEGVRAAIDAGASVNARLGEESATPLIIASGEGHSELVELLVANHADLDATSKSGMSAVAAAFIGKHPEVAEKLIEAGAKVGSVEATVSMMAGHVALTRSILRRVDSLDERSNLLQGYTPLIMATRKGMVDFVSLLLEFGADPNFTMEGGEAPIHFACNLGFEEIAVVLLESGARIDSRCDTHGHTALMLAAGPGHLDVVRTLITRGADLAARDIEGSTPLYYAAAQGRPEVARELLSHGADVDGRDAGTDSEGNTLVFQRHRDTPLHHAVRNRDLKTTRLLLESGADVEALDGNGNTPLVNAVTLADDLSEFEPNSQIVVALLGHGANPMVRDADGRTLRRRLRDQFDGIKSMMGPGSKTTDPLEGEFKVIDTILSRAGARF